MITALATAALLLLQQAAPAAAAAAAATPAPAASTAAVPGKKAADDPNQMVCRTEAVTGTMFPKKTCATRRELAERAVDAQQATRQATSIRPYTDPR